MATSGTYDFAPSNGEVLLYALGMCGIRSTAVLPEHMFTGRMAVNLLLSSWSNKQPNLWNIELVTVPLIQGTAVYDVDPAIVMILDAYIRTGDGTSSVFDRLIFPISRTEYASYPNKDLQAQPTVFWFDRLIDPTLTLWQVPNADDTYLLRYYAVKQNQDSNLYSGQQPTLPYRWLDAFASGIAARLAVSYAPDKAAGLKALADEAWTVAATQDVEDVPLYISPGLSGYFVR